MERIFLDKTINLTKRIMGSKVEVPSYINVYKELGEMKRFSFKDSKVELPMEHLGLAVLSYKNAVDQYVVTRLQEDTDSKRIVVTREFDSLLSSGAHISDFISTISPDALNWLHNGKDLLGIRQMDNKVVSNILQASYQCKVYNEKGEDLRALAVREAYHQAVKGYVASEMQGREDDENSEFVKSLQKFVGQDISNFENGLNNLKEEALNAILIQHQENPSQMEPQPAELPETETSQENMSVALEHKPLENPLIEDSTSLEQ